MRCCLIDDLINNNLIIHGLNVFSHRVIYFFTRLSPSQPMETVPAFEIVSSVTQLSFLLNLQLILLKLYKRGKKAAPEGKRWPLFTSHIYESKQCRNTAWQLQCEKELLSLQTNKLFVPLSVIMLIWLMQIKK